MGAIKVVLDDKCEIITINCDLIIHSRGKNKEQDNLIAIEMKKSNRKEQDKNKDRKRLCLLTKNSYPGEIRSRNILPKYVCRYIWGYYIEIGLLTHTCLIERYTQGNKDKKWEMNI